MTELVRKLLEGYLAPVAVYTDLSAARVPSYAVAHKGDRLLQVDVAGGQAWRTSCAVNLRHAAVTESDRQRAYGRLGEIGAWLCEQQREGKLPLPTDGSVITDLRVTGASFHEVFDDGGGIWTLGVELDWEK